MPPHLPARGPLTRRVGLGFQFVGKLIELVEINSGPEPERVGNNLRYSVPTGLCLLAETGAERPVYYLLEWHPELARAPLQYSGQVIIDSECGAHL
jgi:hypothetical protein